MHAEKDETCEHDFSIPIVKQKSIFCEVVTTLACRKCGKTISTGKHLHDDN